MLVRLAGLAGLAGTAGAAQPDTPLPPSRSLPRELDAALARGEPLVVLASLAGCAWCRLARNNYLAPMRAQDGVAVVQVDFRGQELTQAFDGTPITHDALIRRWQVVVAPTVLFFGPQGREIAPRIEGMSEDFYAAQLDGRLRRARQALRDDDGAQVDP
ncbi:MAG: hypothetical protein WCZ18_09140 [Ottowia sp.]|nr:hypothetical protein [Ottowia sp.]